MAVWKEDDSIRSDEAAVAGGMAGDSVHGLLWEVRPPIAVSSRNTVAAYFSLKSV